MGKLTSLTASMMKVGLIGFGGGNALIPVIEQEAVKEKKMVTKEEFDKDVIAATLTPGALPVELASGVGYQFCGIRGLLAGGVCMALPGAVVTVMMLAALEHLSAGLLEQIEYASIGITAFIMCLLTEYISGTLKTYRTSPKRFILWGVIAGVFILSAGKNIYGIFQLDVTPVFGISTVDVLLVSFFAILYTGCRFHTGNVLITAVLGGLFLLCRGRAGIIQSAWVLWGVRACMLALTVWGVCRGEAGGTRANSPKKMEGKPLLKKLLIWILFFSLLSLPAFFFTSYKVVSFDVHGLISSFLSFGGGDAYLTIADGLFVPGFIQEDAFYNHLVLIVNVLPGSILCKTLTGIGYVYGASLTGGVMGGVWMALAGFACSVAASCGIFYIIFHAYEWLEGMQVFSTVKKSIRVIVSGLLLTVMAGLIKSGIAANSNPELPWFTVLLMISGIYVLNLYLYYRMHWKNLTRIVISLILSVGLCNLVGV